jgi:hypothetical protein
VVPVGTVQARPQSRERREHNDRNLPTGVTLVHVIAALRARVDDPREPTILAIQKSPQTIAFLTCGDPGGRRGSLPADLNMHVRVGADVQVPSRMVVRPAVRTDNDEISFPAGVDQRHGAIEPRAATACGEKQSWRPLTWRPRNPRERRYTS